jgi:hypothetical protein
MLKIENFKPAFLFELKSELTHIRSRIIHIWAFPYGSGYALQSFFAAGATQKKYFRSYP